LTTAFNVDDLDDLEAVQAVKGYGYIRTRNPNRNALAELMTYLEGGANSLICNCGMAAISTALLSMVGSGDHILSDKTLYGEDYDLFSKVFGGYGIEVTYVDFADIQAVERAIQPNTKVLYTETISNPLITVVDIPAVVELGHRYKTKVVVDNTFATPILQKPLLLGADIVVHSATKYLGGHSDLTAGAVVASRRWASPVRDTMILSGGCSDPGVAYLLLRGLKTLDVRIERACRNDERRSRKGQADLFRETDKEQNETAVRD